jgi:hypothetical protein
MQRFTLPAGAVVQVNGFPVRLLQDSPAESETDSVPITKSELFSKCVMVRASGGEPAKLTATSFDDGPVVGVLGEDGRPEIGFPIEDVFEFDGQLFDELSRAHRKRNSARVSELWERATPFHGAKCS